MLYIYILIIFNSVFSMHASFYLTFKKKKKKKKNFFFNSRDFGSTLLTITIVSYFIQLS